MMASSEALSTSVTKSLRSLRVTSIDSTSRLARLIKRPACRAARTATLSIGCMAGVSRKPSILDEMTLPSTLHQPLAPHAQGLMAALRFVLVAPSHAGNIGSVVRAMKTMGLEDLVVVNPKE